MWNVYVLMYHLTQLKCCQRSNVECVCTAVPLNTVEMLSTQQCGMCMYCCTNVVNTAMWNVYVLLYHLTQLKCCQHSNMYVLLYHITQLKCCQHSNVECVCSAVPLNTAEMLSTQQYVCTAVPHNTVEMLSTRQCGMCMYYCTT